MDRKSPEFYKGMDISSLPQCMEEGMAVKDFDGTVMEPFLLLQKYGVNSIRLRIWKKPENVPESGGYCNLEHTLAMAKKIKAHDMHFLLDFHYSDFWADPANQRKPKEWENLTFEELEQAVYDYTKETLLALKAEGVLPDMVQIGNEIRSGMLFPDGELPDYAHMVRLINAGIRGARSVADAGEMQVMIHLDQGGRYFYLKEWFSKAFDNGLEDFDVIGVSYYPFWHGSFSDLKETLERLVQDYHKPMMVVETAYAWRRSRKGFIDEAQEKIAGLPATPEGQAKELELMMNIVASLPDCMGRGVYYWEPLNVPGPETNGWAENMGLLEENGRVMEGIKSFGFTREQLHGGDYAKVYAPLPVILQPGQEAELPEELAVLCYDGSMQKKQVTWESGVTGNMTRQVGEYQIAGRVEGISELVAAVVKVSEKITGEENLLRDVNWDEGMAEWDTEGSSEQVVAQIFPEFPEPFPAPPLNALRVEGRKNFTFCISQRVFVSRPGRYCLTVEFKGADTTNVDVRLFAQCGGERKETVIHPTEHAWEKYEVDDIVCEKGSLTVGISIQSPPNYGMMRKFSFIRTGDMM